MKYLMSTFLMNFFYISLCYSVGFEIVNCAEREEDVLVMSSFSPTSPEYKLSDLKLGITLESAADNIFEKDRKLWYKNHCHTVTCVPVPALGQKSDLREINLSDQQSAFTSAVTIYPSYTETVITKSRLHKIKSSAKEKFGIPLYMEFDQSYHIQHIQLLFTSYVVGDGLNISIEMTAKGCDGPKILYGKEYIKDNDQRFGTVRFTR